MLTGIAIGITGISIALLLVYGADVAAVQSSGDAEQGFLPFDAKVRGMALGAPALVLPFIAFGMTWRSPSGVLGAMIIVTGILIMAGGGFVLANADMAEAEETGRPVVMEGAMLLGAGAVHIAMGFFGVYRSRRRQ
ncbi:MAG: hypothetical protein J4F28_05975 [Nitrosopumilaceae archaeon]|nr:hypothetical protein [Nitrosopumilaceae archaeon]